MRSSCSNQNRPNLPCRVCGFDKNTGRNFGVVTCSTCKAFFRRNGRTGSVSIRIYKYKTIHTKNYSTGLEFGTMSLWRSMFC